MLSEELPKHDAYFTSVVAKTVDTLRNLLNNDPSKLEQHVLVDERPVDEYVTHDWRWNEGRYGTQRSLRDMTDILSKVRYCAVRPKVSLSDVAGNDFDRQCHEGQAYQLQPCKGVPHTTTAEEDACHRPCLYTFRTLTGKGYSGNLSVRSLADVVSGEDFIQDSEYLETLLVAVPKCVTLFSIITRFTEPSIGPTSRIG